MYSANGIALNGEEFELLSKLSAEDFAGKRSVDGGDEDVYRSLCDKDLVKGVKGYGAFVYLGLTVDGRSFVRDWEAQQEAERKARRSDRRHDYLVAAFSGAVGFAFGVVLSYLTHCFGMLA